MKRIIKLFAVIFTVMLFLDYSAAPVSALEAASGEEEIRSQIDEILDDFDITYSYDDMSGLTIGDIINSIKEMIVSRFSAPFRLLGSILIIVVFSAFMKNSGETFFPESKSANLYNMICAVLSAAIISSPLFEVYENTKDALNTGGSFMLAFVPIYAALAFTSGGVISAGVYNTITLAAAELLVQLADSLVMPLLAMMTALAVTGSVFPNRSLDSIMNLIKKCITWGMTVAVTLFSGFVSLKSTLGNTVDGFAVKSVKFVISGFVPVIGSAVSDAYSTVKGSFDIMRCTAGTAGTISIVMLLLPLLIELIAFRAVLWIGASAAEMFSSTSMEKLLKGIDCGLAIAMSVMVCFGVLFVISTAILMKSVS